MTKKPAEFNLKAWCARKCPYFMPMLLFAFALIVYVIFVVFTIYDRMHVAGNQGKSTMMMIIFHISAFMFLISYIVTARSDPGSVPKNPNGPPPGSEQLGHKFCHTCNVPKPERCHHCSICQKCIRNMDHHCPWVNNCIGYANKKYFLLMLFYVNTTFFIAACGSAYEVYAIFAFLFEEGFGELKTADYLVVLSFLIEVIGLYNIGNFFRFHMNLINTNRTTLEDLDLARGRKLPDYDVGCYQNYAQNCGTCSPMWICPFFTRNNGPTTDGYSYPKKGESVSSTSASSSDRKKPDLAINVSPAPTNTTMAGSSYFTSPPHSATHSPFPYYSSYS